jgi:hypothetical protein
MPWAKRGKRTYFYKSYRCDGQVKLQYLGSGKAAVQEAAAIEKRRHQRHMEAAGAREYFQVHAETEVALIRLAEFTDLLVKVTLLEMGYHQHDRTWRKRRVQKIQQHGQCEGVSGGTEGDSGESVSG